MPRKDAATGEPDAPLRLAGAGAAVHVPDGSPTAAALQRTTCLGIGAHPDDLEILAIEGILSCFGRSDRWFTGVIVTDGAGSPRSGRFANFDDQRITAVRRQEQHKAAKLGGYSAVVELSYPSCSVKAPGDLRVVEDLEQVLSATLPEVVYTHDLADPHETHVAVTLRVLEAARRLPPERRPRRLIGCEVWRGLDWLPAAERVVMLLEPQEQLQLELLSTFESQIAGGKRYDLAVLGRRRAHATFAEHDAVDASCLVALGMDLTPLVHGADPVEHVESRIQRFAAEVRARLERLSSPG